MTHICLYKLFLIRTKTQSTWVYKSWLYKFYKIFEDYTEFDTDLAKNTIKRRNTKNCFSKSKHTQKNSSAYKKYKSILKYNPWVVATSNQFFKEVFKLKQNFQISKVVTGKTLYFVKGPFCTPHSICLDIGFW